MREQLLVTHIINGHCAASGVHHLVVVSFTASVREERAIEGRPSPQTSARQKLHPERRQSSSGGVVVATSATTPLLQSTIKTNARCCSSLSLSRSLNSSRGRARIATQESFWQDCARILVPPTPVCSNTCCKTLSICVNRVRHF